MVNDSGYIVRTDKQQQQQQQQQEGEEVDAKPQGYGKVVQMLLQHKVKHFQLIFLFVTIFICFWEKNPTDTFLLETEG